MGTVLRLDTAKRSRTVRRKPSLSEGDAQIVLFTGVRYDRSALGKSGGHDPNGAQPGRQRI